MSVCVCVCVKGNEKERIKYESLSTEYELCVSLVEPVYSFLPAPLYNMSVSLLV